MGETRESNRRRVHYVITVHGMGESREFETSRLVANLFGTGLARPDFGQGKPTRPERRVSLGTAGGVVHSGEQLWVEFEGVPQPGDAAGQFTGLAAEGQLRFVDFAWNEVSRKAFSHHGEAPEKWAESVLARLEAKTPPPPVWVAHMLGQVRRAVLVLRRLLVGRFADISRVAFDDYLGDVQMYGDYVPARGRAIRGFHDLLAQVHAAHEAEFGTDGDAPEPAYIVIAHSLGTVMAFDALMAAHEKGAVDTPDYGPNPPARNWARHVRSFVTLGSPIDKFLLIWWYRYAHLLKPDDYARDPDDPIRHFNYCDEQDPVGHNLDIADSAPGFRAVFHTVEDRVYNRYAVPGKAHLGYFDDVELFQWIHARAIEDVRPPQSPPWFVPSAYKSLLRFTYFLIPFLVVLLNTALFLWAWTADGIIACVTASAAFLGTWWLGRMLIDLSIWWRQIQRAKWRHFDDGGASGGEQILDARRKHARTFRVLLWLRTIVFFCALTATAAWVVVPGPRVATILAAMAAAWAFWRFALFPDRYEGPDRQVTRRLANQDWATILCGIAAALVGWTLGRWFDPPGRGHAGFLYAAVLFGNAFVVSLYVLLSIYHCKRDLAIDGKEADATQLKTATTVDFTTYVG